MEKDSEIDMDITLLLGRAQQGDRLATRDLLPLVYDELRILANHYLTKEAPAHTLQPTALVHEAYIRLIGTEEVSWENRQHFFGAATQAIRRILTDHARSKRRVKRGGGKRPGALSVDVTAPGVDLDVLAIDEALERLSKLDSQKARLVELKFFGGLTLQEIGRVFGMPISSVMREWRFTRTWLYRELASCAGA